MEPYIYLDHTADVKFAAYGKSLEEAFSNALLATFNLMTQTEKIMPKIKKEISVSGRDREALLYNFLEESLFLFENKGFIPSQIQEIQIDIEDRPSLKAILIGDKAEGYEVRDYIKAVTYSEMEIKKTEDGYYRIQVVLDV